MVSDREYARGMGKMYARMAAETLAAKFRKQHKAAVALRDKFKPLKRDRGNVILVGRNGKRVKLGNLRQKGIPVFVNSKGKKQLYVRRQIKNPYALRPFDNIKLSSAKNLRNVTKKFQLKRLREVGRGKLIRASRARKKVASEAETGALKKGEAVTPGEFSESVQPARGKAFDSKTVDALSESLLRAINTQRSKQVYLVTGLALVEGEYGRDVVQFTFSMGRSEQHFFRTSPRAFVRTAFYADFARQLAFLGYITSGSSNHIRKVTGRNVTQKVWEKYHADKGRDMKWQGAEFNIVDLISLEWKIERT